jgi:hypothetical protein
MQVNQNCQKIPFVFFFNSLIRSHLVNEVTVKPFISATKVYLFSEVKATFRKVTLSNLSKIIKSSFWIRSSKTDTVQDIK